jgi:hypothetical protein
MALKTTEHLFTGTTALYTAYDSTKTNLGKWIQQKTGPGAYDKYAGPMPLTMARPFEQSTAIPGCFPYVIDWSSTISWIFLADNAAVAATRRIVCYTFNKTTQDLTWHGFITLTYPAATNHTIRGLAVARHTYTTGTAATSGTAVTGAAGAAWQTARIAAGARIGFGSTDPTAITTWYHISAIGSETGATLVENAGTISAGSYVIEELRIYTTTTNATAANGGLFVAKGINYDDFIAAGLTIAAATTTDNLKAVYWLADATTVLNTVACGLAIDSTQSDTSHFLWVVNQDAATTARIYKYDGRVALAGLASGKSVSAFVFRTGQQASTGTIAANGGNGIIVTAGHGPGSGAKSLYFVTSTRIYRCLETAITNGGTTFLTDSLSETPTGGANTFAASSALTQVVYDSIIDRFIVFTTSISRQYVTAYSSSTSTALNHVFLFSTHQIDQSLAVVNNPPIPHLSTSLLSGWSSDGILYVIRFGTTITFSQMYIWPLSVDWQYASGGGTAAKQQRLITPSINTTGCKEFYRVYTNHQGTISSPNAGVIRNTTLNSQGSYSQNLQNPVYLDDALALPTEPFRTYYRTANIASDAGAWTLVSDNGDLTAVAPADAIQFMYEFKAIGNTCLMPKLFSTCVVYEDDTTDSHYEPSVKNSNVGSKIFAWRFSRAFGTTVPTLIVRIYDEVTDGIIAADTTASPAAGTFQKSTNDGGSWSAYDTTDKTNETTYIRYTVTGTMNGVKARAVLQQYGSQATGSGTPAGSLVADINFGQQDTGDRQAFLVETDVGTANALVDVLTTTNSRQDVPVEELRQQPVPISNRRKVR